MKFSSPSHNSTGNPEPIAKHMSHMGVRKYFIGPVSHEVGSWP